LSQKQNKTKQNTIKQNQTQQNKQTKRPKPNNQPTSHHVLGIADKQYHIKILANISTFKMLYQNIFSN